MREVDMREALETYASDGEPAMGLTASGILTAGRRSRRNRRLAGVAGVGLVAVLAGMGGIVVSGGDDAGPVFGAAGPCPFPPGTRPPGAYAADRTLSPELAEWAATSLTCHLNEELPRLLPKARYAQVPGVEAGPLIGFSLGGEPPWGNRVDALALVRDAEGTGDLTVTVGVVDASTGEQAQDECRRTQIGKCTVRNGPDGVTVLVGSEADDTPADEPRNYIVRVYRGHSEIYVQASNTDRQPVDSGAPARTRPQPILSEDQAVALALSPELFLFP
ncbi:hypothetical protein GCM10010112_71550 [Actinoplanes lobatus]|uniref:Uncharacterized protein n=1 Tax=Actinoplanes lobatus TaxID=113568 RepID=A0A7W7MKA7_9ACTN|nr:hypothetical protein [Actinoplanes lobatus]MBB4752865.1 hypothetical protein [Actinoplanes lobatus]GGN88249.1 hypothetical protein GCM10010112_71550 [Actinoplanes lobatus]GIE39474.1 hypothetical protein Alo02nite_23720 [Actinoplanes lobatus]